MLPRPRRTPKPLMKEGEHRVLENTLRKGAEAGVDEVIVNAAYLADQIISAVEHMEIPALKRRISLESESLETGGGLVKALPMLGSSHFLLINSDVWTDFDVGRLVSRCFVDALAHLVLVSNPPHNPAGDFFLFDDGHVAAEDANSSALGSFTFSGISVLHPNLIKRYAPPQAKFPMRDLLLQAMRDGQVTGEFFDGEWIDIGTPERLQALRKRST